MQIHHSSTRQGKKIVVIVGGGFAGFNAAKEFKNNPLLEVILIDEKNHHLFQPLLYQVATAGLNSADIAAPIRAQFAEATNISVHWGKVKRIHLENKSIFIQPLGSRIAEPDIELFFDYLILACGARHSYFGHPEWEELAPGLKTLEQAIEIRRRILSAFERAENETAKEEQKALLNFVVVGGGPTGVELAGAIADISRTVLVKDFRRIDPSRARVILIEAGPRILASFEEELSLKAQVSLTELGVEVRTSSRVENIDQGGVSVTGEYIASRTVLWAAGVTSARIEFSAPVETDRSGRVKVSPSLSIPKWNFVFVAGDMASIEISPGKFVPGLAPAAMQAGRHAAQSILDLIHQRSAKVFKYKDKGQLATIGKRRAILQNHSLKMAGFPAWFLWMFIHIFYLIGFKNRVSVLSQWAWSYLFSKRGARLITDKNWQFYGENSTASKQDQTKETHLVQEL
ncbi:MAG: NAD(P)/FAD-dependent oxidoreductase [Pseudobdellovibrionaceae bacterium]